MLFGVAMNFATTLAIGVGGRVKHICKNGYFDNKHLIADYLYNRQTDESYTFVTGGLI